MKYESFEPNGSFFMLNENTMLGQGDCLELMKTIPDGSVDLILTDPPYGMDLVPQRKNAKFKGVKIKNDTELSWSDLFFERCYRVAKKNTASMFFCNHFCIAEFIGSAKKAGYEIKNLVVWDKGHFGMGGNWRPCHELVLICTKGRFVTHSKNLRTIVDFKKVHYSKAVHPTEKPVALLEDLIKTYSNEGNTVLDFTAGSMSTAIACINTNRKGIMIEKDPHYFKVGSERVERALSGKGD